MVLARALKQCCQRIQREQELACVVILDGLSGIYKLVHLYRRLRIGRSDVQQFTSAWLRGGANVSRCSRTAVNASTLSTALRNLTFLMAAESIPSPTGTRITEPLYTAGIRNEAWGCNVRRGDMGRSEDHFRQVLLLATHQEISASRPTCSLAATPTWPSLFRLQQNPSHDSRALSPPSHHVRLAPHAQTPRPHTRHAAQTASLAPVSRTRVSPNEPHLFPPRPCTPDSAPVHSVPTRWRRCSAAYESGACCPRRSRATLCVLCHDERAWLNVAHREIGRDRVG